MFFQFIVSMNPLHMACLFGHHVGWFLLAHGVVFLFS
uniref:Ankyrin-repeat protein B effector n=1 Tax=Podoviridae sp. ctz6O13 TaxID=2827757 RepID=A0A8S5TK62_9CAUD|nr:MAG TPA: Ankyrin-repeat protein B effector [Podoviridae sp. ctz6O13]